MHMIKAVDWRLFGSYQVALAGGDAVSASQA